MSYTDVGEIALWPNKSDNERAPLIKGHVEINGTRYEVGLWKSKSDNPNAPTYWGKVQMKEEAGSATPRTQEKSEAKPAGQQQSEFYDDDIPF